MTLQSAALLLSRQGKVEVGARSIPAPGKKQALVKIEAAALNPVDRKVVDDGRHITTFPAVIGMDGAGTVVSVGPEVPHFHPGDRVLFQGDYSSSDESTLQQYALADVDAMAKIPSNIDTDQASTIPVASVAALFGLFQKSGVDFPECGPTAKGKSIFIFGGSTSVGQYAIQFARIAGFSVIATTAATRYTERLKALGATHVFNRDIGLESIMATLPTMPVHLVFDVISNTATLSLAIDILSTPRPILGAHLSMFGAIDESLKNNMGGKVSVQRIAGCSRLDRELSTRYWRVVTKWLEEERIVPNQVYLLDKGLSGISDGLDLLRKGVNGVKLVIRP